MHFLVDEIGERLSGTEDLRKAAIEQISGMGVASNWINEPLIESVENEMLRGRMVAAKEREILGG